MNTAPLGGAALLMAGWVLSRLLGLVREAVIAGQFGTGPDVAAYQAAFRLPDLVFNLLAAGAFGSAFIPVFHKHLTRNEAAEGYRLAGTFLVLFGLAALVLVLVAWVAAPALVALLVPGFDAPARSKVVELTRLMLLQPLFFSLSLVLTTVHQAHRNFLLPAVAPILYNLAIIAAALALAPGLGVDGLAVGVVAGSALHMGVQLPRAFAYGPGLKPNFEFFRPEVVEVLRLLVPRAAGLAVYQLNFWVLTAMASLISPAAVAALGYAWALLMVPFGVLGLPLGTAYFPELSRLWATGDLGSLRRTVTEGLGLSLYLGIPASAGLIILAEPLVRLLLQRGSFDEGAVAATTWALWFFALGLWAQVAAEILVRTFYATGDTLTPVAVGAGGLGLTFGAGLALFGVLAHGGLAAGFSLSEIGQVVTLYLLLGRRLGDLQTGLARDIFRSILASELMVIAAAFALAFTPAGLVLRLGAALGVAVAVYGTVTLLLGSRLARQVLGLLRALWPGRAY
ncbi:MAG: murein biosynthesis integral membrane protein MurJ [Chloroflexota bacterium]